MSYASLDAILQVTLRSRRIEQLFGRALGVDLAPGTFREDVRGVSQEAAELCALFGVEPIRLHYGGQDRRLVFEAFTLRDADARFICLSNRADHERAIVGHELAHRLRAERPALYAELVEGLQAAGIRSEVFEQHVARQRRQNRAAGAPEASADAELEEFVCDAVGDLLLDPDVWQALRRPSLLQRVRGWIAGAWRRVRGDAAAAPLIGAQAFERRQTAVATVRDVLSRWARSIAPMVDPAPGILELAFHQGGDGTSPAAFYSPLHEALSGARGAPSSATAEQWVQWLDGAQRRGEFRKSEREWMKVDAWLKDQAGRISRAALTAYVAEHVIEVRDVLLVESDRVAALPSGWRAEYERNNDGGASGYVVFNDKGEEVAFGEQWPQALAKALGQEVASVTPVRYSSNYRLPGGQDYSELLLVLPPKEGAGNGVRIVFADSMKAEDFLVDVSAEGFETLDYGREDDDYSTVVFRSQIPAEVHQLVKEHGGRIELDGAAAPTYGSRHWDEQNVLVHVRFNERPDPDGRRVLFIEELQSDWAQEGRRQGFSSELPTREQLEAKGVEFSIIDNHWEAYFEGGQIAEAPTLKEAIRQVVAESEPGAGLGLVPDMPFKSTEAWALLGIKRLVRWAAEHGFDRIAWTTGAQQVDRYDLSKQVDCVRLTRIDDRFDLIVKTLQGVGDISRTDLTLKEVESLVGKDLAEKAQQQHNFVGTTYQGADLRVGGHGMMAFYDDILPATIGRWIKRYGAQVTPGNVSLGRISDIDLSALQFMADHAEIYGEEQAAAAAAARGDAYTKVAGFDLTPALRDAALAGLPLFRMGGAPDTEAFRRWFGASKVVDDDGKPLVVYHGTALEKDRFRREGGGAGIGAYFTANPAVASEYAMMDAEVEGDPPQVIPVYLSLQNPFYMTGTDSYSITPEERDGLEARGYDGIIGEHEFIAFRPEQIKSATANVGTYDPNDASILYRRSAKPLLGEDREQAFRAWFADSKIVDADGSPRMLYHGTARDFDRFRVSPRGSFGAGIYLTADPDVAEMFAQGCVTDDDDAGERLMPLYARMVNPYRTRADFNEGEAYDLDSAAVPLIKELFGDQAPQVIGKARQSDGQFGASVRKRLIEQGYDGIIATYNDGSEEFVAFHPEQVKSATANIGTFDVTSPSIVYRRGDDAELRAFDAWFRQSKVVNDDGSPAIVYHGTTPWKAEDGRSLGDFDVFDRLASVNIVRRRHSVDTIGSWFSSEPGPNGAEAYSGSGGAIYPVYLSIQNPYVTTFDMMIRRGHMLAGTPTETLEPRPGVYETAAYRFGEAQVNALRDWLKGTGRDGIKITGSKTGEFDHQIGWIALEPEQIKSAIANHGTYDPANPSIVFRRGDAAQPPHGDPVDEPLAVATP